jgi:hypothetical protein
VYQVPSETSDPLGDLDLGRHVRLSPLWYRGRGRSACRWEWNASGSLLARAVLVAGEGASDPGGRVSDPSRVKRRFAYTAALTGAEDGVEIGAERRGLANKGTPGETLGRKATGHIRIVRPVAGLPNETVIVMSHSGHQAGQGRSTGSEAFHLRPTGGFSRRLPKGAKS